MARLGLALSGGGFRATLYHLGVVRFLKDAGVLGDVTDIASVSGGSILAAHLTLNWERYTGTDEAFDEAAAEMVRFVQFDVRNHVVRRMPLQLPLRWAAKLTRRSVRNLTPNAVLERCYEQRLFGDRCLYELPEEPALHLLATSVSNGGLTVFNREGLYIQQRGDASRARFDHVPGAMASIPRVVGASSAFPGFFPPVEFTAADLGVRDGEFPTEYFTDGGVYDNLGIRAFSWLEGRGAEFDVVLVSDAGKPFQILSDNALGFVGQSVRATDILWDRVWQLERENFGKQDGYVFMPITESVTLDDDPTLHPVVQAEVQSIRTDLDRFSDEEVNALAQHGYEVARKAYRASVNKESSAPTPAEPWAPVPAKRLPGPRVEPSRDVAAAPPTTAARRLRGSAIRRVWSTLLDWRDWPSYLFVALAAVVLVYLPMQVYELYRQSQLQAMVIDSIASGDPDIRKILDLIDSDPTQGWTADPVEDLEQPTDPDYKGIEILAYSRVLDLRNWRPDEPDPARQGTVFISDRVDLKLTPDYRGDRRVTIAYPTGLAEVEFRQQGDGPKAVIRRHEDPIVEQGLQRTLYELEYDLTMVPIDEPVTIELDFLARIPQAVRRAPFFVRMKTDLVSAWMLFPEDRPYRNYELVQYWADRSASPEVMNSRYEINHPYGSLIGWSVANPEVGSVYECRWTH